MSDPQTPTEITEAEIERLDPNARENFKRVTKAAKEASRERDEALSKLAQYERQDAFRQAGVSLEGPGALLAKAYEGPNDAEAIKAEAAKYGIPLQGQSSPADQGFQAQVDQQLQAELAAQQRIAAAGAGAPPAPGAIPLEDAMRACKTSEELQALLKNAPAGSIQVSDPILGGDERASAGLMRL